MTCRLSFVLVLAACPLMSFADGTDRILAEKEVQQTSNDFVPTPTTDSAARYLSQKIPKEATRGPASEAQPSNASETVKVECQSLTREGAGITCLYSK